MGFSVTIKHWHGVAEWTWGGGDDDMCGICRTAYDGCAPEVKYPGDDSPVVWGACGHAFHLQCIQKWLASSSEQRCPMCRRNWSYKSAGDGDGEGGSEMDGERGGGGGRSSTGGGGGSSAVLSGDEDAGRRPPSLGAENSGLGHSDSGNVGGAQLGSLGLNIEEAGATAARGWGDEQHVSPGSDGVHGFTLRHVDSSPDLDGEDEWAPTRRGMRGGRRGGHVGPDGGGSGSGSALDRFAAQLRRVQPRRGTAAGMDGVQHWAAGTAVRYGGGGSGGPCGGGYTELSGGSRSDSRLAGAIRRFDLGSEDDADNEDDGRRAMEGVEDEGGAGGRPRELSFDF